MFSQPYVVWFYWFLRYHFFLIAETITRADTWLQWIPWSYLLGSWGGLRRDCHYQWKGLNKYIWAFSQLCKFEWKYVLTLQMNNPQQLPYVFSHAMAWMQQAVEWETFSYKYNDAALTKRGMGLLWKKSRPISYQLLWAAGMSFKYSILPLFHDINFKGIVEIHDVTNGTSRWQTAMQNVVVGFLNDSGFRRIILSGCICSW